MEFQVGYFNGESTEPELELDAQSFMQNIININVVAALQGFLKSFSRS